MEAVGGRTTTLFGLQVDANHEFSSRHDNCVTSSLRSDPVSGLVTHRVTFVGF